MTIELIMKDENEMSNLDEALVMLNSIDEINSIAKKQCRKIEDEASNHCEEIASEMKSEKDKVVKEICENMTKYFRILKMFGYTSVGVANPSLTEVSISSKYNKLFLPCSPRNCSEYTINENI